MHATGLLLFTIALVGAIGLVVVVLSARELLRRHEQRQRLIATMAPALDSVIERLDALESRACRAPPNAAQRPSSGHERLRDTAHSLSNLVVKATLDATQTQQLVVPAWLRRDEAWAKENGWTVNYTGCAIEFSPDDEPERTAKIVLPLGSHLADPRHLSRQSGVECYIAYWCNT